LKRSIDVVKSLKILYIFVYLMQMRPKRRLDAMLWLKTPNMALLKKLTLTCLHCK